MLNIDGHNIYFPNEFTEDMLNENEILFHNKTIYIIDWYCRNKNLTKNEKLAHKTEIYDTSKFISNHILVIHLVHGDCNIDKCEPVEIEVRTKCDIAINMAGSIPSFSWVQRKNTKYIWNDDNK